MFLFDYFVKKQNNEEKHNFNDQININIETLKNIRPFDQIAYPFESKRNSLDERQQHMTSLDERQNLYSLNENNSKRIFNDDSSSLDNIKDVNLNKEMEYDLESNNTFKTNESNETTISSKNKIPHQLRYMNTVKNPTDNINNESVKFFENIVEGEYKRKELYTSEQYEGWCPILTTSNINKKTNIK